MHFTSCVSNQFPLRALELRCRLLRRIIRIWITVCWLVMITSAPFCKLNIALITSRGLSWGESQVINIVQTCIRSESCIINQVLLIFTCLFSTVVKQIMGRWLQWHKQSPMQRCVTEAADRAAGWVSIFGHVSHFILTWHKQKHCALHVRYMYLRNV